MVLNNKLNYESNLYLRHSLGGMYVDFWLKKKIVLDIRFLSIIVKYITFLYSINF